MAQVDTKSGANKFVLCKSGFLTCRKQSNLQEKWLSDNLLVDIINNMMNISITKSELNRSVTNYYRHKCDILLLHVANCNSVYISSSERRQNGKRDRINSYYFTSNLKDLPQVPSTTILIYNTK